MVSIIRWRASICSENRSRRPRDRRGSTVPLVAAMAGGILAQRSGAALTSGRRPSRLPRSGEDPMAEVTLRQVRKSYGPVAVIEDLDLDILDRELLVLVGPSGCGKSTALRMIAGLEEISGG